MSRNEVLVDGVAAGWLIAGTLEKMWEQWTDDRIGCCHVCCGPCSAIYTLARRFDLDSILERMPGNAWKSDWWIKDEASGVWQVDREWLGSWWTDPPCTFTETHQQLMEE